MHRLVVVLILLAACSSTRPELDRSAPGQLRTWREVPVRIGQLLVESLGDSCGVCIREKRDEAFEIADAFFVPGTLLRGRVHRVDSAEPEWSFEATEDPRVTLRVHTDGDHLVGVAPALFTDPRTLARVEDFDFEVVPFAYGDGAAFLFLEADNRIQVQCRLVPRGD